MTRALLFLIACLGILFPAFPEVASAGSGEVFVIPVKGEISQARFFFIRRALKEAESHDAAAIILNMDTYGGDLDAAVSIQKALEQVRPGTQTVTYINPNAASAGAMIALSTKTIYMAPVSAIGAAAPVQATGEDLPPTMADKTKSYYTAYFRSAAVRNGHNPAIAEAFILKETEVVVDGKVIHPKGSLLTLSAQEATEIVGGKPLLAKAIVPNLEEVIKLTGETGPVTVMEATNFESFAFWITRLAPLLLLGGLLLAWIEFKTAGFGVAGVGAAILFGLFFFGHFIAGLAGWEAPLLFLLGVALIVTEFFVLPGVFVPGLIGVLLVLGSLFWAMVDFYPQGAKPLSTGDLQWPMLKLALSLFLACVTAALLLRFLPESRLMRRFILETEQPPGPSFSPATSEFTGVNVGDLGTATTILRPSGKAVIEGISRDVITQGDFIESGSPLRVVAVEGVRIVVEKIAAPEEEGGLTRLPS